MWWKCDKGHSWSAVIASRTAGSGCPYCAGRKVWKGFNDLASNNAQLLEEWDYKNNFDVMPDEVTPMSNKKVWWKCKLCGYSWRTAICNRSNGTGCPACAKRKNRGFFGNA